MPNWLGDVVMALPILRAIRKGRPDMEMTLLGKAAFKPLFDRLGVADRFIPLPTQGSGFFTNSINSATSIRIATYSSPIPSAATLKPS